MMWSTHSRRIDPISRSAKPFCRGEAGAVGLARVTLGGNRRMAALPRWGGAGRGWCGRLVPDAHGAQWAYDDAAPIADEVTRSLIPRKCLRYLTCNPFCRRICCDVDPDEGSAAASGGDEGLEEHE